MIDSDNAAIVTEHHQSVEEAVSAVVTVLTARHHTPICGSNVDIVLQSKTTQSGADMSIIILITWYSTISYWSHVLQEWSQGVSADVTISMNTIFRKQDNLGS